ncbi:MAG: low temperature requirement protein A, partial [Gemmatimonadota bacterium]|nr:low temperature requirement protein A [Gemmatimonadota bacterium]
VFWLVWWAWTQYTWALNAADTTHPAVQLGTLVATAVAFFMAVALPGAFGGGALWFAIPYVLVRTIGLALYIRVAWVADPSQHAAVRSFAVLSIGGLVAVVGGAMAGGTTLYWLWGMAILLDVIAALAAAESEHWNLHPEHFAERHGLFVIIALGESLIVAGGGLAGTAISPLILTLGALAVGTTCALWWSYFACAKYGLDHALEAAEGAARAKLARDAFSLFHFPLVLGVIGVAAAVEEAVLHPSDPLDFANRAALGVGILLFTGSTGLALWRATGRSPLLRFGLALATAAAVVLVGGLAPVATLGIAFAGVGLLAGVEHRAHLPVATLDL